ncbi:hypothetical protein [Marinobacter bohaiensis]|uniref:hypothetical protein n=1 Tax=Marinobacter bohaiensis TaxID=2201898 RepID=UPI000DAEBBF2|nr:hypothetical protein [Marinobacter bohaiensis]
MSSDNLQIPNLAISDIIFVISTDFGRYPLVEDIGVLVAALATVSPDMDFCEIDLTPEDKPDIGR